MSAASETTEPREHGRAIDTIGGLLSAIALFFALSALAYKPMRLATAAAVAALVATAIGGRHERLARVAVFVTAACWAIGCAIAVATGSDLF